MIKWSFFWTDCQVLSHIGSEDIAVRKCFLKVITDNGKSEEMKLNEWGNEKP